MHRNFVIVPYSSQKHHHTHDRKPVLCRLGCFEDEFKTLPYMNCVHQWLNKLLLLFVSSKMNCKGNTLSYVQKNVARQSIYLINLKKINLMMPVKYVFVKTFYSQSMHNKLNFFCKFPLPYIKQKTLQILRMAALSIVFSSRSTKSGLLGELTFFFMQMRFFNTRTFGIELIQCY